MLSTLLGTLATAIASRMQRKSLMQTILAVLLVVGVMLASFSLGTVAEEITPEQLTNLAGLVTDALGRFYPPAIWLGEAMVNGAFVPLGLLILVSAGAMAVVMWLVIRGFRPILGRLSAVSARHDFKLGALGRRSLLRALFIREAKRYFASSVYVTNTIIGPIMGAIMAVALAVAGPDAIPLPIDLPALLPFAFAAVFCMMTTSSVSISMEGRSFWAIKSLPIPTKALLDAKILLNLVLMLPFFLIALIAMAFTLGLGTELLWFFLIPASLMVFVVVLGITVNLRFHSFDWEKEETVVKQSLPAALGGFAGFVVSLALGAAMYFVPAAFGWIARLGMCVLLWVCTAWLYRRNCRAELRRL